MGPESGYRPTPEGNDELGAEYSEAHRQLYNEILGPGIRKTDASSLARKLIEYGINSLPELTSRNYDDVEIGHRNMKYLDIVLLNHGLSYADERTEDVKARVEQNRKTKEDATELEKELRTVLQSISISPSWYSEVLENLVKAGVRNYSDFVKLSPNRAYKILGSQTYNKLKQTGLEFIGE